MIDSGKVSAGNGGPSGVGSKKDVALKVDRADGFVLRNMTMRHAIEHDLYILETDGYLLDRVKFFYAGEYGQLTFADDHGVTKNCESVGNGDSAVYPGGAPDSGDDTAPNAPDARDTSFYPHARLNQNITRCDLHHNNMATSGTMGNATHITHNNIYGNGAGIVTDSFYAGGHPGFPQSASVFEKNRISQQQLQRLRMPDSDVEVHGRRAGRRRRPDRGRQLRHRPRQQDLRQLAPRDHAPRGARRDQLPARRGDLHRHEPVVDVVRQPLLRQPHGTHAERQGEAERSGLLVGRVPEQHRQLLVQQHRDRRDQRELDR